MPIGSNFQILVALRPGGYMGCFKDEKERQPEKRDLQLFLGQDVSRADCEEKCRAKGFPYFGRQKLRECWCGSSYGVQGEVPGCECEARKCCPRSVTLNPNPEPQPPSRRQGANIGEYMACIYKVGSETPTDGRVKASISHTLEALAKRTGIPLHQTAHNEEICQTGTPKASGCAAAPVASRLLVECTECEETEQVPYPELGEDESYTLRIRSDRSTLKAQ